MENRATVAVVVVVPQIVFICIQAEQHIGISFCERYVKYEQILGLFPGVVSPYCRSSFVGP